ncbi:hypothetical protein [Marinobacter sp. MBR-105]|jgi:chromosome segregation ATPase
MKADEIRTQLQGIQRELESLNPVTDAELSAQVAAGGNADELVEQAAQTDKRRRTLAIQADALQKQLSAAIRAEAGPAVAQHQKAREKAIEAARKALQASHEAVTAFTEAISQWEAAAADAEQAGHDANMTASQAGLSKPVPLTGIGSSEFYQLERRIAASLNPHRRDGSQLNKQQIDLEG